jgi:cytochrome c-type biogenesis protein CcmH
VKALRRALPVLLVIVLIVAAASLGVVARRGHARPISETDQVQQIAAGLHCPICKDLSVADSPAPLAQQMRAQIAQELRAGRSAGQIRAGFVAAYGDSVLMSPPRHGLAAIAYILPVLIVAAAAVIGALLLRRWRRTAAEPTGDEPELSATQRRALDRALARLREEEPG